LAGPAVAKPDEYHFAAQNSELNVGVAADALAGSLKCVCWLNFREQVAGTQPSISDRKTWNAYIAIRLYLVKTTSKTAYSINLNSVQPAYISLMFFKPDLNGTASMAFGG
jgi:hypothetical protein